MLKRYEHSNGQLRRAMWWAIAAAVCVVFSPVRAQAGIRGPGKYTGVVVFNRWGGCILYSGVYLMYVSERVKARLRPYESQAIRIHATRVMQPMNPGDGLIKEFGFVGSVPLPADVSRLKLTTRPTSSGTGRAGIVLQVLNVSGLAVQVNADELAPTLLTRQEVTPEGYPALSASDSPAIAVITRESFWVDEPRWKGGVLIGNTPYSWSIGKSNALPRSFVLKPGQSRQVRFTFTLPAGEYDFFCGYGGGVHQKGSIASNRSSFDVTKDGRLIPQKN